MKNIILFAFLLLQCTIGSFSLAQTSIDSITYASQRKRVNNLLDQRSKRFGDFTASLEQKTGVFGLFKTKGDMQKSIDILKSVVINDNAIFLETRKLLNIKDSEAERNLTLAKEYDQQVTAYMKTISKLQAENELLREKVNNLKEEDHKDNLYLFIGLIIILLSVTGFILYKKRKK